MKILNNKINQINWLKQKWKKRKKKKKAQEAKLKAEAEAEEAKKIVKVIPQETEHDRIEKAMSAVTK